MAKRFLGIDVVTAAEERTRWTFDNFERIYVSFSGGKDSTVMLHIAAEEARRRLRQIGVLFVDLEGQYRLTVSHVEAMFEEYADVIDPYWVALPLALRNAVSVFEPKWECWEPGKEDIWIRQPPDIAITDTERWPWFRRGMEFEDFVPEFGEAYANGQRTANLIGIRTDESLNRWRTLSSRHKETLDGRLWTTKATDHVYKVYPIYDWKTEDLWTWHGQNPDKRHNRLYDLMWKAGLTPHQMRICQPYGDDQRRGLWLYQIVEPDSWAKVVARVNGANGGAQYMQEWGNINGYRKVTKPDGHTWKSFARLLLSTMPPLTFEQYHNKIVLFEKWWMERGYPAGIPDEAPYELEARRLAPSWRRVCKSILRNDYWGKGLGFTQHKSEAYQQYLDLMRRRKKEWGVGQQSLGFAEAAHDQPSVV